MTLFIASILLVTSLSAVVAQKVVPPGQIGKANVPPGQIRRQFTYGHMKEWVPLLTGLFGCCLGSILPIIGNIIGFIIGYLLGDLCIRPNL
jgi:hypothetical protein